MEQTQGKTAFPPGGRLVKQSLRISCLLAVLFCLAPAAEAEVPSGEFRIIPAAEILAGRSPYLSETPWFYLLFLAGPAGLLGVILLKKYKHGKFPAALLLLLALTTSLRSQGDPGTLLHRGVDSFHTGKVSEALDAFILAAEQLPANPLLHYNLALCYANLEQTGQAVFQLKKALHLDCNDSRIRDFLLHLETLHGLGSQVDSNPHFHPDIPLVIALVFSTLSFILLALMQYIKKGQLIIILILGGFFTLLSLGVFIYEQVHIHQKIGVITGGLAPIKQIPDDLGMEKIKLKEGSIVRILWQFEDTFFIRTGRGLKGWVKQENLLR